MTKAAADIAAMNEWIDVDEALPDADDHVFVCIHGRITVGAVGLDGAWAVDNDLQDDILAADPKCDDEYFPSHWMPLIGFPGWCKE